MAEDDDKGSAIVRQQTRNQALAIAGKRPNTEVFWCLTCGFKDPNAIDPNAVDPKTGEPVEARGLTKYPAGLSLEFDDGEVAALGGDIRSYGGPCPVCGNMTLVPKDELGADFKDIDGEVGASRMRDYHDQANVQANVLIDRVKQELVGSSFAGAAQEPGPEDVHDPSGSAEEKK